MKIRKFHTFLHKQILIMLGLSLLPGLGYIFLGWLNDVLAPALVWYGLILAVSIWGYQLHKAFVYEEMSRDALEHWYTHLTWFFYAIFMLWTLIFVLYAGETESNLHYIAIFTQIGASVVASALLFSDRKLFIPIIFILMLPLSIYFGGIGEWYSYILTLFSLVFTGVLLYASNSSHNLLLRTHFQASHDQLTSLYNRNFFIDYLQQTINSLKQTGKYSFICLIDLDHFKTINDSLGHDIGDKLLQEVAARMLRLCNQHTVSRLGGDEFIIVGPEYKDIEKCSSEANNYAEQMLETLKQLYVIENHHLYISASIGVSILGDLNIKSSDYIKEADIALYEVKATGRDGVIIFNDELSKRVQSRLQIERQLHFALQRNEIQLNYQPQFDQAKKIIGCETLVRWINSELGNVSPAEFIPVAEQTGIIIELGKFILEEAFITLKEWDEKGIELKQFSVNISMRQFFHHTFVDEVRTLMKRYLDERLSKKVIFELTETIEAEDIKKLVEVMNQLKQEGVGFSMDDFGTGYSSLSYLRQLPVNEIKIDRSFVSHMGDNENDKTMINTILSMAKIFNLNIVAEGVESSEQCDYLAQHECNILQGYYFSKPVSKQEFENFYFQSGSKT